MKPIDEQIEEIMKKQLDERFTDFNDAQAISDDDIKIFVEAISPLIQKEREETVRGFSVWLVNIARTQMAKPFISADQLELGTEDYIIRYLSQTKGGKE